MTVPVYIPPNSVGDFHFSSFSSNLLFVFFLIIAILIDVRWYFIVIFICVSVMVTDVEHLVRYFYLYVFFGKMSIQVLLLW